MRTFAIGDIHGNYRGLLQVLERSGFDKGSDRLFVLGDVCDGWDEVVECIDLLLTIPNMIAIMGNHDEWTRDWLKFGLDKYVWLTQGGQATVDSYSRYDNKKIEHLENYFEKTHDYYIDENNNVYVHGGWVSKQGIEYSHRIDYLWDRSLWYGLGIAHHLGHTPARTKQFNKVFIGHTALGSMIPEKRCNCWNLDTGAGWNGKLTIMNVDTEEYWQSDITDILYPEQKGRRG